MLKGLCKLTLSFALVFPSVSFAFNYKKIEDFKTLEAAISVAVFESEVEKYTQDCLDNTGGGAGGIPCYIADKLWDRELNIYYKKLMAALPEKEKSLLQESQIAWLKERDKTITFNTLLLNNKYKPMGTGSMYELMRAGDVSATIVPIIKSRVLYLKYCADFLIAKK